MSKVRRPRVAAVGLDRRQVESITHLCGDLRPAASLHEYLKNYSETETDILVTSTLGGMPVIPGVHVFTIGSATSLQYWHVDSIIGVSGVRSLHMASSTERELNVGEACPEGYRSLAVT